jgi:3-deoxy-D-manno-octulosonic-acid transferase
MRIIELGAAEAKVKVTGNMKFDMDITQPAAGGDSPKTPSGPEGNAQLFVAGSTHEGEEHILLDMYAGLLAKFANIRLLIAPRHVERAGRVETLARRRGFGTARISSLAGRKTPVPERTVLILDAVGHLAEAYSAATIVFVGGSLVEYGGHNLIEPAVFGKPVLFGPHMSNFRDMASAFIEAGGAIRVQDSRMLFEKVLFLLNNAGAREELGRKAREVVLKNRGATERNIGNINKLLKERGLAA